MMVELPERKTPVHLPVRQSVNRSVIVFLTVCTQDRKPLLARPEVHKLLRSVWSGAGHWKVGRYVLMPDHLHLFCAPERLDGPPLSKWVQFWKSRTSQAWPWPAEQPIWQKSFWDTQLQKGEWYGEKWGYVRDNPVRKALVACANDWPYQGELNILEWRG